MTSDPAYMTLVPTMINLARDLNLEVEAEGVETEDQADLLRPLNARRHRAISIARRFQPSSIRRSWPPPEDLGWAATAPRSIAMRKAYRG